jgi:nicotinate-nucleotide pyrophosphorylase (carboxylating)
VRPRTASRPSARCIENAALSNPSNRALPALPGDLANQVARALSEDIGSGDVTAALIPADQQLRARVITREPAVICGVAWVNETFRQLDPSVTLAWHVHDGETVSANQLLFTLHGPARPILTGERTALNFLQLLSGTATVTRTHADAMAGTDCRVLDTRKTLPGLRTAQKYAVACGGGSNHRIGLYDQILLKENHIAAAGSISAAVSNARRQFPGLRVEVETENLEQVNEALSAGADIIMLDDFSLEDMRRAVAVNRASPRPAQLEASGGVSLQSLREIATTGVNFVSVGALTKHVRAIDLSMRFE